MRLSLGLIFGALSLSTQAATLTVGSASSSGCTHNTLAAALSSAASNGDTSNTIRLANNQTYTGINVNLTNGKGLTIEGGYDNCTDTTSNPNQPTELNALAGSSMFVVNLSGGTGLNLTTLIIQGGSAPSAGGGIDLRGGTVVLDNVQIRNNQARFGGGVSISGGGASPSLLQIGTNVRRSYIYNNTATPAPTAFGGGVNCTAGGSIDVYDGEVSANSAGLGGGIYLIGSCTLHFKGTRNSGIRNNTATLDGGGIYADGALIDSTSTGRLFIDGNSGRKGAAIFASDGSSVDLRYPWIKGNTTNDANGSVISVIAPNTALVLRGGPLHLRCENNEFCSQINGNGGSLSAIETRTGAVMELERMHLTGFNGTIAPVFVTQSELRLSNTLVSGNQNTSGLFQPLDSGTIRFRYSTVTDNITPAIFTNTFAAPEGNAELYASIAFNSGGLLAAPSNLISFTNGSCLTLVNENSNADGVGLIRSSSGLDSNFVPTAIGSAVDSCPSDPLYVSDLFSNPRPFDAPIMNTLGPQDAGAIEYQGVPPLFANGFE